MNFIADEHIPRKATLRLRALGHHVLAAQETCPGASDVYLIGLAVRIAAVILTLDKDFSQLVKRVRTTAECGIVLFRIGKLTRDALSELIVSVSISRTDWRGALSVVRGGRIRRTSLPPTV